MTCLHERADTSALLGGLFNIQTGLSVRVAFVLALHEHVFFSPIPYRKHELYQWLPLLLKSSDGLHWPRHPIYLEHSGQHACCLGPCQSCQLSSEYPSCSLHSFLFLCSAPFSTEARAGRAGGILDTRVVATF